MKPILALIFCLIAGVSSGASLQLSGISLIADQKDAVTFKQLPQSFVKPRTNNLINSSSGPAPPLLTNFIGFLSNGQPFVPDTMGAAGPNHLMITINGIVIIQNRKGQIISSVSADTFWSGIGVGAFDPRLYYDPYANRWILSSGINQFARNSALLLAVSATSDPTGVWHRYRVDADPTDTSWADFPKVGFNSRWIVVQANMEPLSGTPATEANRSHLFIFNKTNVYAGGSGSFSYISVPGDAFQSYDIIPCHLPWQQKD